MLNGACLGKYCACTAFGEANGNQRKEYDNVQHTGLPFPGRIAGHYWVGEADAEAYPSKYDLIGGPTIEGTTREWEEGQHVSASVYVPGTCRYSTLAASLSSLQADSRLLGRERKACGLCRYLLVVLFCPSSFLCYTSDERGDLHLVSQDYFQLIAYWFSTGKTGDHNCLHHGITLTLAGNKSKRHTTVRHGSVLCT